MAIHPASTFHLAKKDPQETTIPKQAPDFGHLRFARWKKHLLAAIMEPGDSKEQLPRRA